MGESGQKGYFLPNGSPFCTKGDKMEQKAAQTHILRKNGSSNDENGAKTIEKEAVMNKSVKELETEKSALLDKRFIATELKKQGKTAPKPKTSKPKGVTTMTPRMKAEKVLEKVAKELKLPLSRLTPKRTSSDPIGALRMMSLNGDTVAAVRQNDIVMHRPFSVVKYGWIHPGIWEHCTKIRPDDSNLEKAFRNAGKAKGTTAQYKADVNFSPRQSSIALNTEKSIESQEKVLKDKLAALRSAKSKLASKTKKKAKVKGSTVLAKVNAKATA